MASTAAALPTDRQAPQVPVNRYLPLSFFELGLKNGVYEVSRFWAHAKGPWCWSYNIGFFFFDFWRSALGAPGLLELSFLF